MSNYMKVEKYSTSNGPGIRNVLWLAGCPYHCKGCHNPETWDENAGRPYDESVYLDLIKDIKTNPSIFDGISILGGEPLYSHNIKTTFEVLKRFKNEFPTKSVWVWTGGHYEDVPKEVLTYIDVLVDGPFVLSKMDLRLTYCGSSNQRVIDVKKSLSESKIILYKQN